MNRPEPTLSALMVTWNERELVERCLPPLVAQLGPGDELIVADNGSSDGTRETVERLAPSATLVRMATNEGRMAACNAAAARAGGDLLLVLDADATVADGFIDAIRRPAVEQRGWDAWMGVVTMDGGRLINTSAGVSHFTGISWTRQIGEPVESAPTEPEEDIGFVTGVCLTTTREAWERTPWFSPEYFLYWDDVDYSWRVRLAGGRIGLEPSARVDHLYDFRRARPKWRMLERNRWATLIRVYPAELLALVAPALVATELVIVLASVRGGWAGEKLLAWRDVIAWLPRLLRERRAIQAARTVSAAEFARTLTPDLSSPYLGAAGRSRLVRTLLRGYWRGVLALLSR